MTTATPEASAPESIVVSLEWAKKLMEAGWPQTTDDSYFQWSNHILVFEYEDLGCPKAEPVGNPQYGMTPTKFKIQRSSQIPELSEQETNGELIVFAAPTAEEILRRLPTFLQLEDGAYDLRILKMTGHFNVWYSRADTVFPEGGVMENSLANASAAMYVYLAENKLLPTP